MDQPKKTPSALRIVRGAVIGGVLGALLTGVPWLGLGGAPKSDWGTAFFVAAVYGAAGAGVGLIVGAIIGAIVSFRG